MAIFRISGSLLQGGKADRLVHSLFDLSLLVHSLKRRGIASTLMGLVIFLLACALADAGAPGSQALPAKSKASAMSEKPQYLIFWYSPEKSWVLVEQVGMKGDGKTRLLGFCLPLSTFELEEHLPGLIRRAFAAAREHGGR